MLGIAAQPLPTFVPYIIIRIVMARQANWWVGVTSPLICCGSYLSVVYDDDGLRVRQSQRGVWCAVWSTSHNVRVAELSTQQGWGEAPQSPEFRSSAGLVRPLQVAPEMSPLA